MNILKKAATKTLLSFTLATTLFFTSNVSGSIAHAGVGEITYVIPKPNFQDFSHIEKDYNNDLSDKTVILTTNDVHGAIDGYPYLAGMKKYFGELGADVLVVDSGDFSQTKPENEDGTKKSPDEIFVTPSNGLAIDCMNSVGYDIVALGNHEGTSIKKLESKLEKTPKKFDIVDANVLKKIKKDNQTYYEPYFLENTSRTFGEGESQVTIGFFGLDTSEAKGSGIKVLTGEDMATCAQEQYDKLKGKGADIVICLSHLGLEKALADKGEASFSIYKEVNQIDLMIDGHSHSIITPSEGKEPILSTGTEFQNIGVVIIDNKEKKITDTFLIPNNVFTSFAPISPANNDAAAATAKDVERVKKESQSGSKK